MNSQFRTAVVFPGMGPTRFADVGKFMLISPYARRLTRIADDVLGYSLTDRFRQSESDYSEAAQVAFLVNCLAMADWAGSVLDVSPDVVVGPSFGGKAAAAFSGSVTTEQAIWITAELARLMADYFSREHTDAVTHSFLRTPADRLREIRAELDERGEWNDIACRIDDDFHMLSLREPELAWLQARIRSFGGMSLYTMRPPLHSAAFADLRDQVEREVLSAVSFADPILPIVADQDGRLIHTGAEVRTLLLDTITRALDWPAVVATLREHGVREMCVSGPDTLFGRVAVTTRNFEVHAVNPRLALQPRKRLAAV